MRRPSRHSGFTLIETIAAIVILAIAVPPMFWSLRDAYTSRVQTLHASQARWLATEKLEDVVADRHSTTRGYTYIDEANYADEPAISGAANFARTVSITETSADLASAGTGYKNVTVTVSWTDLAGTDHALTITTVLTELAL
jgi:prepilin-type N-terminal cleavage/methylation domain-containing protein